MFLPSLGGGGAERTRVNLAGEFVRRGLRVDLVVCIPGGALRDQVAPEVRIVDLGATRVVTSLPAMVRYLRRERPDAMLSAIDHANLAAIAARAVAGAACPHVITVHTTLSRSLPSAPLRRSRWAPPLMRFLYPVANKVVCVSQGVADDLMRLIGLRPDKVQVIYNPVVTAELCRNMQEPLDHPWFVPGAPPVVLAVGRLTPAKDYPTLLKAFAVLRRQRPARLLILGEGEERHALEKMVRELGLESEVRLPGFAANPYPYMARAGVFVLSSAWEGLPTVLVEALACGAPLVATDCRSGPREILRDGKYGKLVAVGSEAELAAAILQALEEPRRPVPEEALAPFRTETVTQAYLECLGLYASGEHGR